MANEYREVMETGFHGSIKALALLLPIGAIYVIVAGLMNGQQIGVGFFIVLLFVFAFGAGAYWIFVNKASLTEDTIREEYRFPPGLRSPVEIRYEAIRRFKFHTGVVYIYSPRACVHVRMGMTDWHHFTRAAYLRACRAQGRRVPVSGNPLWKRQALGTDDEIEAAIAEQGDA